MKKRFLLDNEVVLHKSVTVTEMYNRIHQFLSGDKNCDAPVADLLCDGCGKLLLDSGACPDMADGFGDHSEVPVEPAAGYTLHHVETDEQLLPMVYPTAKEAQLAGSRNFRLSAFYVKVQR